MSIAVDVLDPSPSKASETRPARRDRFHEAYWATGVSVVGLGIALLLYQVWNADLHLPLGYSYDMRGMTAVIKGMGHSGWWVHNPQLGAPFGMDLRDFPLSGQTSQLVVIRIIVAVVHSPGVTINLYYFGGYAVLAAVSFLVFRRLGLSRPVAAALAIAYDFLPFHSWHGADHLTHSTYFAAPLGVLLIVRVLEPQFRLLREPDRAAHRPYFGPSGSLRFGSLAALVGIAIIIGSSDEMLSCFTVVMLVIGGLIAAIATRRASRLIVALLLAATIVGTFLLLTLPTILYVISAGKNPAAGHRLAFESDLYGLRPALMLLPTNLHWVPALRSFSERFLQDNTYPSEGGQAIGTLGAIGVVTAIGMVFTRALREQSNKDAHVRSVRSTPLAMPLAVVIMIGILLGTGGATFLDTLTGFVQIRTWNWVVLLIAFAAFTLTGFGCERVLTTIRARTTDRRLLHAATVALVLVVAGVGILDGGRPPLPNENSVTAAWVSDQAFVAAMHTVQPPDGMIFQFPVMATPESWPIGRMQDYDQMRGYLADKGNFRWSYGAIKGRPHADWQAKLPPIPTRADLRALVGLGFTGIWVNRDGYTDNAQSFEKKLVPILGHPTLISENDRLSFYDLRRFTRSIKPGTDLVAKARARFGVTPPKSN